MKRSNKAQLIQQREIVMNLLLSGASRTYVQQAIAQKYGLSKRSIDKLMADCYKLFQQEHAKQFKDKIAEYDARLNFIYERAMAQNDLSIAFKIIEHLKNYGKETTVDLEQDNAPTELKESDTKQLISLLKSTK